MQKVIDAKLDSAALENLAQEFNSAMFVQLAARSDLHPQSQQLADAVLAAQNAALQNPQRIGELIKQLQDPSAEKRSEAFSGLVEARGAAVSAMIEALADPAGPPNIFPYAPLWRQWGVGPLILCWRF